MGKIFKSHLKIPTAHHQRRKNTVIGTSLGTACTDTHSSGSIAIRKSWLRLFGDFFFAILYLLNARFFRLNSSPWIYITRFVSLGTCAGIGGVKQGEHSIHKLDAVSKPEFVLESTILRTSSNNWVWAEDIFTWTNAIVYLWALAMVEQSENYYWYWSSLEGA